MTLAVWRAFDLNLVMISSLALKWQWDACFFGHFMKWNYRLLSFKSWPFEASEDIMIEIQITSSSYHKKWEWQPFLPHSWPLEYCHLCTKNEILCTILHTTVALKSEIYFCQYIQQWENDPLLLETLYYCWIKAVVLRQNGEKLLYGKKKRRKNIK